MSDRTMFLLALLVIIALVFGLPAGVFCALLVIAWAMLREVSKDRGQ